MYFLGLTFHPNFVQFKKIDSFRKLYDSHYRVCKNLQMSLLPPFEIKNRKSYEHLVDELKESVEDFFLGFETPMAIEFTSIGLMEKKRPFVYLRPEIPEDLVHLQEMLQQICLAHEVKFKPRGKQFFETFLPIAKPRSMELFGESIKEARSSFTLPLELFSGQLSLFEKFPGQWIIKEGIFQFCKQTELEDDLYGNIHEGSVF